MMQSLVEENEAAREPDIEDTGGAFAFTYSPCTDAGVRLFGIHSRSFQ
jgi:hypothetical protein